VIPGGSSPQETKQMSLKWTPALEQDNYPTPREVRGQARRAKERGVTIAVIQTGDRVEHLAFDPRDGRRYYVTGFSCECRQFVCGGQCCHHWALFVTELGWIPDAVGATEETAVLA
jgi:hypothetical protein